LNTLTIILIVFASVFGITLIISFYLAKFLIFPIKVRHKWVINFEAKKVPDSINWYKQLQKEEIHLKSPHNYQLYGEYVENAVKSNKTVVLVHGYRFNFIGSIKYAKMFYDMGYNVLWYDNCKSGKSGGRKVTMGYREKDDLGEVIKSLRKKHGNKSLIGIHGESMGASLSIMYGAKDLNLSFIVEDCGYSSLEQELKHHITNKLHLPLFPFFILAKFFVKAIGNFSTEDVDPLNVLKQDNALVNTPMLFIHGARDSFTPTSMVYDMFKAKQGEKAIYVCEGAGHAQSYFNNSQKYKEIVKEFLQNTNFYK